MRRVRLTAHKADGGREREREEKTAQFICLHQLHLPNAIPRAFSTRRGCLRTACLYPGREDCLHRK